MQDLNTYISGLLFIHDCVILPGFGGFVTNYKPAEHEEMSNTFIPPKKDVMFNKNLTYNDGLLISFLSKNKNITYAEAKEQVKAAVDNAWYRLEQGETIFFDGVGSFSYDNHQNLIFTPELTDNFLTDSYGLASFRFPPLNYQQNARKVQPLYKPENMDNQGIKKTLKWAAVVIPIAGLLTLIPYKKYHQKQQSAGIELPTTSEPIEARLTAMPSDTSISKVMDKTTDKKVALFYNEAADNKVAPQKTQGQTFYVIGGSFKNLTNANEHKSIFEEQGFEPIIIQEDELFRVALCSFNDKVNALHELRRIRNQMENDKFWLYSK